ncbi:MAG: PKD domain-containing protein, partial [Anaerolineales bacterium]|nr:PKD domain-containing protein [Anaerolineales bacterium]
MKAYRLPLLLAASLLALVLLGSDLVAPRPAVRGKPLPPAAGITAPEQRLAAALAQADPRVQKLSGTHRVELFGVRHVGQQFPAASAACKTAVCRQVEFYDFDANAAILALVNVDAQTVLDVLHLPGAHPGINQRLIDLATRIALNHPDVIAALGFRPTAVSMAPVDGGLRNSVCDTHLCVAPTFDMGDRNLWVIIDLTDEKLLHLGWTILQPNVPGGSELFTRPAATCPPAGSFSRDGWQVNHEVTPTDGLRVYDVSFQGREVLRSAKLVEWHVMYSLSFGFEDVTGCGGGGGGFAIDPYGDTVTLDLVDGQGSVVGFEVVQDFRMPSWGFNCNYRYDQRFQFYQDGRFRVVTGAYGRDCGGGAATYRPIIRIDVAADGDAGDSLATWTGSGWQTETTEFWTGQTGPYTPQGYAWRVTDQSGAGFYVEPNRGQFGDGSHGDNAYFYVVAHHPNEGDTDLPVIGDCCATGGDHQQGPHLYLNGESIADENIVIWYVPQSRATSLPDHEYCWTVTGEPNPETYPCFTGPMFVPIDPDDAAPAAGFVSPGGVAVGETAVFSNTTTGTPPITYAWDFGDGSPPASAAQPTHAYNATGAYTVTLQAGNVVGSSSIAHPLDVGHASADLLPGTAVSLTHTLPDGSAITVQAPAGAVSATTRLLLTAQPAPPPPAANTAFAGTAFRLDAYRDGQRLQALAFAQPLHIDITYPDAAVAGMWESHLQLLQETPAGWQNAATPCPQPAPVVRDLPNNRLTVPVCRIGSFALFAPTA